MGNVFAEIELRNPRQPDLDPVKVNALADADTMTLCIPEYVALQLSLETESTREVSVADGRAVTVPYVGPLKVTFGKRFCYVGALVIGDEVLLGAVPMEDMVLVVNPSWRKVTVDPASPNIPHARETTDESFPLIAQGASSWIVSLKRQPLASQTRSVTCLS